MKHLRMLLIIIVAGMSLPAWAQRQVVPIMDFKDIPVSLASTKKLTVDQVGQAIKKAALADRWEITPISDGVLQATFIKESKHTIIVIINYSGDTYSVTYKGSDNMKYSPTPTDLNPIVYRAAWADQPVDVVNREAVKQRAKFSAQPESRYGIAEKAVIHPAYEDWVHNFLRDIRMQLQAM